MFQRFAGLTLVTALLFSAARLVWSQPECDFSYSNYARAVQLHDAGDYDRALRHYECARQEAPDDAIIPILIENVYEDIAKASTAWSGAGEKTQAPACRPAGDHRMLAEAAYERGDINQALIHLQCILLDDPADAAALNLMGNITINQGDTRTAHYYFNRAEAARNAGSGPRADAPDSAHSREAEPSAGILMPDWLRPYETAPDARDSAQARPFASFSERAQQLLNRLRGES